MLISLLTGLGIKGIIILLLALVVATSLLKRLFKLAVIIGIVAVVIHFVK